MTASTRALAIATAVLVLSAAAVPATASASPAEAAPIDDRWLETTYEHVREQHGETLVDVGVVAEPDRHVAVLFDGSPPEPVPDLHPRLDTRAYDVSGAEPLAHDPLVPVMTQTAVDVPDRVRPGAWMASPAPCTLAHVVEDAGGDLYVLTAGHCANTSAPRGEDLGRSVEIVTEAGPTGASQERVGTVVDFVDEGIGADYALVAIDPDDQDDVDPNTVGWRGPTGVAEASAPGSVHHYGFGAGGTWIHDATRCRTGSTPGFWGANSYAFHGLIGPGDSGSPAQTAGGEALGINTHIDAYVGQLPFGNALGTQATHAIDSLEDRTGLSLSLVTGDPQASVCQVA